MLNKNNSNKNKQKELIEVEKFIKNQKLKDFNDLQTELLNKQKSINENIKLIENSSTIKPNAQIEDLIEKNIKRDKIKEFKRELNLLEVRLLETDKQIKKLTTFDIDNATKKLHIKEFLENVEKDKSSTIGKFKKWEQEREERIKHFSEYKQKLEVKIKEENQQKEDELKNKRENFHSTQLEKQKERTQKFKDEASKILEESNNKPEEKGSYFHEKYKKKFLKEMQKLEDDFKSRLEAEKLKRKNLMRSVTKEELDEFQRDYIQKKNDKISELKNTHKAEEEKLNTYSPNAYQEGETYKKIIEEEKEIKETLKKLKDEKNYKILKTKNYAKEVKEIKLPKIDDLKKKELEDRKEKLSKNVSHKHMTRHHPYVVKFKKKMLVEKDDSKARSPSPNDLHRPLITDISKQKENSLSPTSRQEVKKKPIVVKKPLEKRPDYLIEIRQKRSLDEEKLNSMEGLATLSKIINC